MLLRSRFFSFSQLKYCLSPLHFRTAIARTPVKVAISGSAVNVTLVTQWIVQMHQRRTRLETYLQIRACLYI